MNVDAFWHPSMNCTRGSGGFVAFSRQLPLRIWLRWHGAGPHIVGSLLALICVIGAWFGALETVLRQHFDAWWWVVVVATYAVGWLLTGLVLRPFQQSWESAYFPRLDAAAERWLAL